MGQPEQFMYPGYGESPGDRATGRHEVPDPAHLGPSPTGAKSHPFEKQIIIDPIEGETPAEYHDRRRKVALEAGHALYRRTHGIDERAQ